MGIGEWAIIIIVALMFIKPEKAKEYTKVAVKVRKYIREATEEVKSEVNDVMTEMDSCTKPSDSNTDANKEDMNNTE